MSDDFKPKVMAMTNFAAASYSKLHLMNEDQKKVFRPNNKQMMTTKPITILSPLNHGHQDPIRVKPTRFRPILGYG